MKRDMEVIRGLLLWAEHNLAADQKPAVLNPVPEPVLLEHMVLLIEAGFVEGEVGYANRRGRLEPVTFSFERLTWQGHEFISLLGRGEHWEKIKSQLLETGASWSLTAILDFLKTRAGQLWLGGP